MNQRRYLLLLILMVGSGGAYAAGPSSVAPERVIVGRLVWTRLYPRIADADVGRKTSSLKTTQVSNSCGISETKYAVEQQAKAASNKFITVWSVIGEWCQPSVEISKRLLLVGAEKKGTRWWQTYNEPVYQYPKGRYLILPESDGFPCQLDLSRLREPIPKVFAYGPAKSLGAERLNYLVKRGVLSIDSDTAWFASGIYLDRIFAELGSDHCTHPAAFPMKPKRKLTN